MLLTKKMTLTPLLESANGVHLTAYLVNRHDLIDLKAQLQDILGQAYEWLNPVMSIEERNKFLEPVDSLLQDPRIFNQMKGNIGIFRNKDCFRVLNIPVNVEPSCHVATSFHVKPLLKWLQTDQDFLLLGIDKKSAHLYLGNQESIKCLDSVLFPEFFKDANELDSYDSLKMARQQRTKEDETFTWLNTWLSQVTINTKPKLFLAGEKRLVSSLCRSLRYENMVRAPVSNSFNRHNVVVPWSAIRKILKEDSHKSLEKVLCEFRFAEGLNLANKNIFQIAKAVVQGRVRKLIIMEEISIFGKIDRISGGLAIHPFDQDHEDDDILDDLAQMVLSQGGEVIVAPRNEIPKGRPILAILEDDETDRPSPKLSNQ
jgi:hypothetical protein